MKKVIGILSYEISNILSVYNAFKKIDEEVLIIKKQGDFEKCSHLVLPGVGTFQRVWKI